MENNSSSVEALIERIKNYAETRIDLLKLKAIDKSSSFLSLLISMIWIIMMSIIFLLFISIGLALWVGSLLKNYHYGFFIVGGFFALIGLILFLFRNKWLKTPLANMMIKKLLE